MSVKYSQDIIETKGRGFKPPNTEGGGVIWDQKTGIFKQFGY